MSGLFGGGQSSSTTANKLAGIQLMTSVYGDCLPVAMGRPRIPAKLVYYQDFKAIPHTTTQKVGKGGGSTMSNTTYTYTVAAILVLCEGKAVAITKRWADKDRNDNPSTDGFTVFPGEPVQSPWGYVTTRHPDEAVGYGGMVYLAKADVDLGENGSLQNYSFEVATEYQDAANGMDALLSTVVRVAMTHPRYGMGWAASRLDAYSLADFANYCRAANIAISPLFDSQRPGIEVINDLMKMANAAAFPSQGVLKIVPYQDTPVGGWTPNTAPVYDLGLDDFTPAFGEDPVKVDRSTQADAFNRVQVEFRNRFNDHAVEVAEASDQANIEAFGLRPMDPVQLHSITDPYVARDVAQRILQRVLYVRNTFNFQLGPRHMLLEPMDLVTLTEPGLGLDHRPARVITVEYDASGGLDLTAEEWPFGTATATRYPSAGGTGGGVDLNAVPGDATRWQAFEVPGSLTEGRVEVWMGAAGGPNWGGCDVWVSRDGNSYTMAGTINAPARMANLSAVCPVAANTTGVDTTSVVHMANTLGQFTTLGDADAAKYAGLCWLNGEFLSYQQAALTGAGAYDLSSLRRGLHGSPTGPHPTGSTLIRVDDALLHLDAEKWEVGSTIYIKLASFNLVGGQKQDLSTVQARSFTIQGLVRRWPAPTACTITIAGGGTNPGTPTLSGALASVRYSVLAVPGSVSGAITTTGEASLSRSGSKAVYYLVTLDTAGTLRATMVGDVGMDTWLTLWKADSTEVTHNDDSGGVLNRSEIQASLQAGTYVLECTAYNAATGNFTLDVTRS